MRLLPDPFQSFKKSPLGEDLLDWWDERTADAFLLSFPKCGRTWLRLMVGRILQTHFKLEHHRIERRLLKLHRLPRMNPAIPKIIVDHDDYPHWKKPSELAQSKRRYAHSRVVFLVRDPRDTIVSFYFEQSKRVTDADAEKLKRHRELRPYLDRIHPYRGTMQEFIREESGSFDTLLEYYNVWERNRARMKSFMLLKYEDLRRGTQGEMRKLMDFVGLAEVPDATIAEAVEFTSFDNMRKMEAGNAMKSGKLAPTDKSDQESYKTRKGKVGGYRDYLGDDDVRWLNDRMRTNLSPWYGYVPE